MNGQSLTAIVGRDRPMPGPLEVKWSPPKAKPKGLDWSKHTAPAPVIPIGNDYEGPHETVEDAVAEVRKRIRVVEPVVRHCDCGAQISGRSKRCRSCNAKLLSTQRTTYVTRTSIVDLITANFEYVNGATCPEIAQRHGWPVVSVRRQLQRAGVAMRDDRAGRSGGKPKINDPATVDRVRKLYIDQGLSQGKVAQTIGTTTKVIQTLMKREGIPARQAQAGGCDTLQGYRTRLLELGVTSAELRTWARAHGYQPHIRGLVAEHIIDAYEQANR